MICILNKLALFLTLIFCFAAAVGGCIQTRELLFTQEDTDTDTDSDTNLDAGAGNDSDGGTDTDTSTGGPDFSDFTESQETLN